MKKLLFATVLLQICILYPQFNSRIFEVMYQGPGGIQEVNQRILFADTKNLTYDLNLSAISSRFEPSTMIGKEFLVRYLEKAISPKDKNSTIQKRQNLIIFLLDHPELEEKLELLLQQAAEHEVTVMNFMQARFVIDPDGDPIKYVKELFERFSFNQAFNQFNQAGMLLRGTADVFNSCSKISQTFSSLTFDQKMMAVGLGLFGFGQLNWDMHKTTITAWTSVIAGHGLYRHYTGAIKIRDSLYSLNRLINIAEQIEELCADHGIEHQFKLSSIRSEKGLSLLKGLQHARYSNKDSYFLLTPFIHSFIYDVYENDEELAPMYASIAEMDAYIAIAKKMKSLKNSDHTFCFSQFLENQSPKIIAKDFWNVLVSKGDVVVNSIDEDRNIILTGSNEGGKTTSIRAILQNIVLSQTFGIAAASEFLFTQFSMINSYLNVSDDILNGKSRFASELKQAQEILHQITLLKPDQKFFFAFDELFTGTNGEDGAECAYRFIDNIASYKGIQFIYATHFNRLKTIGSANPACVNYKIEAPLRDEQGVFIRDSKGQLVYPYKLSLGANDVNVAIDRARDAGIFR
jgi:DNA mismatch repair ATPase MutS